MPFRKKKTTSEILEEQKIEKFRELDEYIAEQVEKGVHTPELADTMKASWLATRGLYLGDSGNLDDAGNDFQEALFMSPGNVEIRICMLLYYRVLNLPENALDIIKDTKKSYIQEASELEKIHFYKEMGNIYVMNGMNEEALKAYNIALKRAVNSEDSINEETQRALKAGLELGEGINVQDEITEITALIGAL